MVEGWTEYQHVLLCAAVVRSDITDSMQKLSSPVLH
jgi:hypothetical protein